MMTVLKVVALFLKAAVMIVDLEAVMTVPKAMIAAVLPASGLVTLAAPVLNHPSGCLSFERYLALRGRSGLPSTPQGTSRGQRRGRVRWQPSRPAS